MTGSLGGSAIAALVMACATSMPVANACAVEGYSVDAVSRGAAVEVRASATIRAPHALIWQTLTDYDRLSQFVPGMHSSRVVDRRGATAIVEQVGEARAAFFSWPIEVTLESVEHPPNAIRARMLKGNFRQLEGGYELERTADAIESWILRWNGRVAPDIRLPMFLLVPLMSDNISAQFRGMVEEIERREAARSAALPVAREAAAPFEPKK